MWVCRVAKWPPARVAIQPPSVENSNDCGKVAQGEPVGAQAVLEVGPERPGPDQRRARDLVDLDDPAQSRRGRSRRCRGSRGRPAARRRRRRSCRRRRDRRQPPVGAHLEHPPHVLLVAREGDHVGGPVEPPAEAADDVAIGAPHRVPDPVRRIVAEDVAEHLGRAQPRRRGLDRGERHRLLDRVSAEAEPAADLGRDRLQGCAGRRPLGVTPPPMAPGRAAGPRSARFHDPTLPPGRGSIETAVCGVRFRSFSGSTLLRLTLDLQFPASNPPSTGVGEHERRVQQTIAGRNW